MVCKIGWHATATVGKISMETSSNTYSTPSQHKCTDLHAVILLLQMCGLCTKLPKLTREALSHAQVDCMPMTDTQLQLL